MFFGFSTILNRGNAVVLSRTKNTVMTAAGITAIKKTVAAAIFKLPLALTVVQILAIDLGTDLLPALALGTEKPEPDVMQRAPRKRDCPLLDLGLMVRSFAWLGLIEAVLCYSGFYLVTQGFQLGNLVYNPSMQLFFTTGVLYSGSKVTTMLGRTVFHAGVVMSQVGNAFACRSEKGNVRWLGLFSNFFLIGGVFVEIVLILMMIYLKPVAAEFGHIPLPAIFWVWLLLFAPVLYVLERTRKKLFQLFSKRLRI